ncbi:hypothetical protein JCM15415_16790 [Methanobacterium movens]
MINNSKIVSKIGFGAGLSTFIFGMIYIMALLATLAGLLKPPWDMAYQVFPSILLAPSFLVLMIAINNYVPDERKIWSNIGVAFAIIYATIVSIVYFTVLSLVLPNMLQGTISSLGILQWAPNSFLQNVDGIGYGFMSLATLFSAYAFAGNGIEKWARRFMIAHGIIIVGVIGSVFMPIFFSIATLWIITFPLFSITLVLLFREAAA